MTGPRSGAGPKSGAGAVPPVGGGSPLKPSQVLERLRALHGEEVHPASLTATRPYAIVERDRLRPVMASLKDDPALRFDLLLDVTAVDHLILEVPEITERFAVVYQLHSLFHGHRFQVKTPVPEDDPRLPSVSSLWRGALWGERETHDMFGIEFEGNPDLRRLLMPENYPGFPLRKDYPLRGRGERDAFPQYRPGMRPAGSDERSATPAV